MVTEFKFRSGHVVLDLPATMAGRFRAEPRDLLATPDDLGRWLVAAGLAAKNPEPSPSDLRDARALREAIYRLAVARCDDKPFAARDRAVVNRWAALPPPVPQLANHGVTWPSRGVRALLAGIARDAVELLGGEQSGRIRQCSGDGCALLFLDTSRAGDRRWCSMKGCGNKAKVAEFRRRKRGG